MTGRRKPLIDRPRLVGRVGDHEIWIQGLFQVSIPALPPAGGDWFTTRVIELARDTWLNGICDHCGTEPRIQHGVLEVSHRPGCPARNASNYARAAKERNTMDFAVMTDADFAVVAQNLDLMYRVYHFGRARTDPMRFGLLTLADGLAAEAQAVMGWHRSRSDRGSEIDGGRLQSRGVANLTVHHSELIEAVPAAAAIISLLRAFGLRTARSVTWTLTPGDDYRPWLATWSISDPHRWTLTYQPGIDRVPPVGWARELVVPSPAGMSEDDLIRTLPIRADLRRLRDKHPAIGRDSVERLVERIAQLVAPAPV